MKIYIVTDCYYQSHDILEVFDSKEKAEDFINNQDDPEEYKIDEREVR